MLILKVNHAPPVMFRASLIDKFQKTAFEELYHKMPDDCKILFKNDQAFDIRIHELEETPKSFSCQVQYKEMVKKIPLLSTMNYDEIYEIAVRMLDIREDGEFLIGGLKRDNPNPYEYLYDLAKKNPTVLVTKLEGTSSVTPNLFQGLSSIPTAFYKSEFKDPENVTRTFMFSLFDNVQRRRKNPNFIPTVSICQSSGSGKSRLVMEVSEVGLDQDSMTGNY